MKASIVLLCSLVCLVCGTVRAQLTSDKNRVLLKPDEIVAQPDSLTKPSAPAFTIESYPKTSGSTSAEPLGIWVACRLLGLECSWQESVIPSIITSSICHPATTPSMRCTNRAQRQIKPGNATSLRSGCLR